MYMYVCVYIYICWLYRQIASCGMSIGDHRIAQWWKGVMSQQNSCKLDVTKCNWGAFDHASRAPQLKELCQGISVFLVTKAGLVSPIFNQERWRTRLWRQLWLVDRAPCARSSERLRTCRADKVSSSIYPDAWPKKQRLHIGEGAQAWWIHFMNFGVVWASQPICSRPM